MSFFFNDTATTEIYTLSLHDALPISVVEVGTVGDSRHHEYRHHYEENPPCCGLVFAKTGREMRVVEVMAFYEWDGRLQRFACVGAVLHHHFLSLSFNSKVLVHLHIGRCP